MYTKHYSSWLLVLAVYVVGAKFEIEYHIIHVIDRHVAEHVDTYNMAHPFDHSPRTNMHVTTLQPRKPKQKVVSRYGLVQNLYINTSSG